MKTAIKKVLSLALVLVLLVGVLPFQAFATETETAAAPDAHGLIDLIPCNVCLFKKGELTYDHHDYDHCMKCYGYPCVCAPQEPDSPAPVPPAPTSLTVKFYLDNNQVEMYTVNAEATVQSLITNYCQVDKTTTVNYGGAKVDGNPVELGTTIKLGEEVHIYLTSVAPAPTPDPEPTPTPDPEPTPEPTPTTCTVCGKAASNGMCTGCYLDMDDCTCKQTTTSENHWGQIKFVPMFNDGFGLYKAGEPVYVKMGSSMADVFAKIAIPANYNFSYWSWDAWGNERINNYDRIPNGNNFVIYAQYAKQVQSTNKGVDIHVSLNYDWKMGETLKNVAIGAKMGDVVKNIPEPTRWGYKFAGWYWEPACENAVQSSTRVILPCTIYAKWEKWDYQHDTMLKIYVNGDSKNVAKIVDMHDYAKDGWIAIDEVKEVVKKYYTAKDSDGLSYYGLYDTANWQKYLHNHRHTGSKYIEVNKLDDTTIYVMVYNAKTYTASSATADASNPKTGDMIMMPMTVLGLSASALAVLFYLNKKRAL